MSGSYDWASAGETRTVARAAAVISFFIGHLLHCSASPADAGAVKISKRERCAIKLTFRKLNSDLSLTRLGFDGLLEIAVLSFACALIALTPSRTAVTVALRVNRLAGLSSASTTDVFQFPVQLHLCVGSVAFGLRDVARQISSARLTVTDRGFHAIWCGRPLFIALLGHGDTAGGGCQCDERRCNSIEHDAPDQCPGSHRLRHRRGPGHRHTSVNSRRRSAIYDPALP